MKKATVQKCVSRAAVHAGLILFCLVVFFPLVWVILIAFQPTDSGVSFVLGDIIKKGFTLSNFGRVAEIIPLGRNFLNTLVTSVAGTLLTLFFCSLAGFAFAKYRFKGNNVLFLFLLLTMVVPAEVSIVPLFVVMRKIGWINNLLSLIVPRAATAVGIFYMRQYISSCPTDLLEQARIDGCREFGIFMRIVLPVITPALASWGAISLISRWNDFILPKIFLRSPETQTLMVSISLLPVSEGLSTPWPVIMAGVAIATLPLILAFVFLQRYDIADVMAGANKG